MRTLAIGDIHGCITALRTLEDSVGITPRDRVIALGDYVDRGPGSRAVIDWLIARTSSGGLLVPLRGNHEVMMCAARQSHQYYDEWIACGGDKALESYARKGSKGRLDDVPEAHWEFIESMCRPYFETKAHFFVHANAYPDVSLHEQPDFMLYWERFNDPAAHQSGKIMVCGHTPQRSGLPRNIGHAVCIDTQAHAGGWLTCLDVTTGRYWQTNESGQTRTGKIQLGENECE